MSIHQHVIHNNELCDKQNLEFPFLDGGFLYGYGLFESIRIKAGQPVLWDAHIKRLNYGANVMDILCQVSTQELKEKTTQLIEKNEVQEGMINIYITAGDRPDQGWIFDQPLCLVVSRDLPQIKDNIELLVKEESFQRVPLDGFKTMAYFKNILERKLYPMADDIILYDQKKEILETPMSNVFFVQENRVITPKSTRVLPGIIRNYLIQNQADLNIQVEERSVWLDELQDMEEVFTTNAIRGIQTVENVEDYPILKSGPITHSLQERLATSL